MKILLWIVATLLGLFILAAAAVYFLVDAERIRPQLEAALTESIGRPVHVGELELSFRRMAFAARNIRIDEEPAFGDEPFLEAEALSLRVALMPLLRDRKLHIRELRIDKPRIRLVQRRGEQWNFSDLTGATPAPPESETAVPNLRVDRLRLTEGSVVVQRPGSPARTYSGLSLELDDLDPARAVPFRFSVRPAAGGILKLDGQAGPMDPANLAGTPVAASIELTGLDLARMLAEAGAADPGLAGILDFSGRADITQGRLESSGQARVAKLRLIESGEPSPQPVELDYQLDYGLATQRGKLGDSRLKLGNTALALAGNLDNRGQSAKLDLTLTGNGMPVDDLQALLPMLAIALPEQSRLQGGTLSTTLRVRGSAESLTISGPVSLSDTRLAGFSIGQRMGQAMAVAGLRAPADTVIRQASSQLRIDDSGVNMAQIQAEIAEFGALTGDGRIGADESLDFRFVVRLAPEAIRESGLSGRIGGALQGALTRGSRDGIGLRVTGSAEAPKFTVDQASLARLGASAALGAALGADGQTGPDARTATEDIKRKAVESLFKRLGGKDAKKDEDD